MSLRTNLPRPFLAAVLAVWLAAGTVAGADPAPALGILNEKHPLPGVTTGGQPTVEQLAAAKAAGYKTIVNLRPAGEFPELDEAAEAKKLGIGYVYLPIAGPADLTEANAAAVLALLRDESQQPMLVHCGSGNRVGALVAIGSRKIEGSSAEEALARGQEAGLTTLEPAVRQVLGLPALPPAESTPAAKPGG